MTFSGFLILEVADMFDRWISRWVRADATALLVLTLCAVTATHGSWMWFFVLFLFPDLSMVGYVFGPRVGAASESARSPSMRRSNSWMSPGLTRYASKPAAMHPARRPGSG